MSPSLASRLRPQVLYILSRHTPCCMAIPRAPPTPVLLRAIPRTTKRLFLTSRNLRSAAPPPRPANIPKPPKLAPGGSATTSTKPLGPIRSFVEILASKGQPTVLYRSPSLFWLRFSSFSACTFCVSYTVVQYWSVYLHPPEGLASWVPHAYGVVCMFMAGMGLYFVHTAGGIVRCVRAVPTAAAAARPASQPTRWWHLRRSRQQQPASTGNAAAPKPPPAQPLLLEFSVSRPLPLLPDKLVRVAPGQARFPFRMAGMLQAANGPAAALGKARGALAEREAHQHRQEKGNPLTLVWEGVKRGLTRDGFAHVKVDGVRYKLDVTGGWGLEGGKALDRLVATASR